MKNIWSAIKSFLVDEKGAETVEWVLIVAILAAIALAAYKTSLGVCRSFNALILIEI